MAMRVLSGYLMLLPHVSLHIILITCFIVEVRAAEIQNLQKMVSNAIQKASVLDAEDGHGEEPGPSRCTKLMSTVWTAHLLVDCLDMSVHIYNDCVAIKMVYDCLAKWAR
jgi:hypothetical protein